MADETKKVLLDININADQFIGKIVRAKDAIASLKAENKSLAIEAKKAFEQGLFEDYDTLTRKIEENENALRVAQTEMRRNQTQLTNVSLAAKATAGSYEQVYQQWKVSEVVLKNLEGTLQRNADGVIVLTDEYKRAKAETENAKNALLAFGEGVKDGRLNVGNYAASFETALSKFPLFNQGLSIIREGLSGVKSGFEVARAGTALFNEGLNTFTTAISQGATSTANFAKSLVGIKQESTGVAAVGTAGTVAATGLNIASGAAKIFKLALISTGVGAFVVIIGSLIAFFAKTKEGADKIEVAMSAIGGVVGSLIKSFGEFGKVIFEAISEPRKLIADFGDFLKGTVLEYIKGLYNATVGLITLDFSQFRQGLQNFENSGRNAIKPFQDAGAAIQEAGKKAAIAATEMAKITKEQQILDDQIRENLALNTEAEGKIKAILAATRDLSLGDKERLDKLKEAGVIEEQLEKRKLAAAEKQLELLNREIELKGISEASEQRQAELVAEVAKIKADSLVLSSTLQARESKFALDLTKAQIDSEKQLIQTRIRAAELAGQDTSQLRIQAARLERDALLAEDGITSQKRLAIQQDYQNKLLEIDRAGVEKRQALLDQVEDINASRIIDNQNREVELERIALERKLRNIKGTSDAENQLREALQLESLERIANIVSKYEAQSLQKRTEDLTASRDRELQLIQETATKRQQELELQSTRELGALRIRLENEEITQAEFDAKRLEFENQKFLITEQALQKEVELQAKYQAIRVLNDQVFFENELTKLRQRLESGELTQAEFDARETELKKVKQETEAATQIETQSDLNEAMAALQNADLENTIRTEEEKVAAKLKSAKAQKEINKILVEDGKATFKDLQDLLSKDEASRKKNAKALQVLASIEVGLNLEKELSGIFTSAAVTAGETGIYGAIVAYALAAVQAGLASARAFNSISNINSAQLAGGGMTGRDGKIVPLSKTIQQFNPVVPRTFKGGYVDRPTLWNLAGEAGKEYVAPSYQLKMFPGLFDRLNYHRETGVMPFADGGFTQGSFDSNVFQADALEVNFARALSGIPNPIVTVEDINVGQANVAVNESRAGF